MEFYRRNYIEGLFLSSGVVRNPDYTMEPREVVTAAVHAVGTIVDTIIGKHDFQQ